ncbi:MAG: hypothetical protein RJA70_1757 [Pseudomonadota bacterium]
MAPPRLENDWVRLIPLSLHHVTALWAAASQDRSSYQYSSVPQTPQAMRSYVEAALSVAKQGTACPFAIQRIADQVIVGCTRFTDMTQYAILGAAAKTTPDSLEIGYTWLAGSAQRSYVNTASKLLLLGHAFDSWRVQRVFLKTDARNQTSRAAIERIGGQLEGILRAHMAAADGGVRDSAMYSILPAEWPAIQRRMIERLAEA